MRAVDEATPGCILRWFPAASEHGTEVETMADMFSVLIPGLPDGFVDTLREAVLTNEIDRAASLIGDIAHLLAGRRTDWVQIRLVVKTAVLSGLDGAERRRAESVLDQLAWASESSSLRPRGSG
jgi:hypothetical protein